MMIVCTFSYVVVRFQVMFSVVALAVATSDSGYWYRVNLIGLRVRSALSSAIYRKSLRLSNGARKKYTAGEIVNLISVDCQKLQVGHRTRRIFFL